MTVEAVTQGLLASELGATGELEWPGFPMCGGSAKGQALAVLAPNPTLTACAVHESQR